MPINARIDVGDWHRRGCLAYLGTLVIDAFAVTATGGWDGRVLGLISVAGRRGRRTRAG